MNIMGLVNGNPQRIDVVQNRGIVDYVQDGAIINNSVAEMVLVSGYSDLELLESYTPGTIAFTAGYQQMWQKAPNGTWASFE